MEGDKPQAAPAAEAAPAIVEAPKNETKTDDAARKEAAKAEAVVNKAVAEALTANQSTDAEADKAKAEADKAEAEKLAREIAANDASKMDSGEIVNAAAEGLGEALNKLLSNENFDKLYNLVKKFLGEMTKGLKPGAKPDAHEDQKVEVRKLENYNDMFGSNAKDNLKREVQKKGPLKLSAENGDVEIKMPVVGRTEYNADNKTLTIITESGETITMNGVDNDKAPKDGRHTQGNELFTLSKKKSITITEKIKTTDGNGATTESDTDAATLKDKIPGIQDPEPKPATKQKTAATVAAATPK